MANKMLKLFTVTSLSVVLASCNSPSVERKDAGVSVNDSVPACDTMLVRVADCGLRSMSLVKEGTYGNDTFRVVVTDSTVHNGKFFPNNLLKVVLGKDTSGQSVCRYYANADDNYTYALLSFAGKWTKEFPSKTKDKVTVDVLLGVKGDASIKGMNALSFRNWEFADLEYKSIVIKGDKELDGKTVEFADTASIVDGQLVVKGGFTYQKVEE